MILEDKCGQRALRQTCGYPSTATTQYFTFCWIPGAVVACCVCPNTQGNEEVKARKEKNYAVTKKISSQLLLESEVADKSVMMRKDNDGELQP